MHCMSSVKNPYGLCLSLNQQKRNQGMFLLKYDLMSSLILVLVNDLIRL